MAAVKKPLKSKKNIPEYHPPKLEKFEKLEKLIVCGE